MISLLRVFPVWQNFEAELERAKTHCACLPDSTTGTPRRKQCEHLLKCVESALARPFPPQLYIWLTFHESYQNLLWLQSPPELLQQWLSLRDRVGRIDKAERGTWDDQHLGRIDAAVHLSLEDDAKSAPARAELRTLRKFLDDRTDSALWQTQALHESLLLVAISLVILLTALAVLLAERDSAAPIALLPTICAAMLGGTLSTLLALRDGDGKGPPLTRTHWPRPLIAAAAGLVLWLLQKASTLRLSPLMRLLSHLASVSGYLCRHSRNLGAKRRLRLQR